MEDRVVTVSPTREMWLRLGIVLPSIVAVLVILLSLATHHRDILSAHMKGNVYVMIVFMVAVATSALCKVLLYRNTYAISDIAFALLVCITIDHSCTSAATRPRGRARAIRWSHRAVVTLWVLSSCLQLYLIGMRSTGITALVVALYVAFLVILYVQKRSNVLKALVEYTIICTLAILFGIVPTSRPPVQMRAAMD